MDDDTADPDQTRGPEEANSSSDFVCPQCSKDLAGQQSTRFSWPTSVGQELDEADFVLCPQCGSAQVQCFSEGSTREDPAVFLPETGQRFQFGKVIGRGSYGVVYEAFDEELRRKVAIKTATAGLAGNEGDLFLREARAASRLRHPNIVTIHDIMKLPSGVHIVSDLIEGESLKFWLDRHLPDPEEAIELTLKILEAMDYAHRHGVIHRDLKPGNVMMDQNGQPHILDFGLSQSIDSSMDTVCQEGVPIGTPAFMAPEQVKGKRQQIDRRSDVYAIGVILFQMLTGRLPFFGNRTELYSKILQDHPDPAPLKSVPKSLSAICLKALAKDPECRYQWASEMAEDLRRFQSGHVVKAYGRWDRRVVRRVAMQYTPVVLLAVMAMPVTYWIWGAMNAPAQRSEDPRVKVWIGGESDVQLVWQRLDPETGIELEERIQSTIGSDLRLLPGFYKVRASQHDETVEVFRTVPEKDADLAIDQQSFLSQSVRLKHRFWAREQDGFRLPEIQVTPTSQIHQGMTFFAGGTLEMPDNTDMVPRFRGQNIRIKPFLISGRELTWSDLKQQWPEIQLPSGASLDQAAEGIAWDIAQAFAESRGMALPTVGELQWAATNGGSTRLPCGDQFPDGEEAEYHRGRVEAWDRTQTQPPVSGLLTGVAEWSESPSALLKWEDGKMQPAKIVAPELDLPRLENFPDRWFALYLRDDKPQKDWGVQQQLISCTIRQAASMPLGFRLVRRLAD